MNTKITNIEDAIDKLANTDYVHTEKEFDSNLLKKLYSDNLIQKSERQISSFTDKIELTEFSKKIISDYGSYSNYNMVNQVDFVKEMKSEKEKRISFLYEVYKEAKRIASDAPTNIPFGLSKYNTYNFGTKEIINNDHEKGGYIIGKRLGLDQSQVDDIVKYYVNPNVGYLSSGLGLHFFMITHSGIMYLEKLNEKKEDSIQVYNTTISMGDNSTTQVQQNTSNSTQVSIHNLMTTTNIEKTIRDEAKEFYTRKIEDSSNIDAIEDFKLIKFRLQDFYPAENKSLFLDEMNIQITEGFQRHINENHAGKKDPNCPNDKFTEKLLFYIKQEIDALPIVVHQKFQTKNKEERTDVFISYSHSDKEYLNDIQRHFKPFKDKITYWDDTKIKAGELWNDEINKAIKKAKVFILLASTDFFGSDFIMNNELPPILKAAEQEGTVVLVTILKPCMFEEFIDVNKFQAINPPDKPLMKMTELEREELYVNLVRQVKRALAF